MNFVGYIFRKLKYIIKAKSYRELELENLGASPQLEYWNVGILGLRKY
jgi:hypothetical protein